MLVKISTDRTRAANTLIAIFIVAIIIGALASEFFQAPEIKNTELSRYQLLIKPEQVDQIQTIELKNRLGEFTLSKSNAQTWSLTSPRNLPSSQDTIQTILDNLKEIRIRKILPKDAINISNYSLDTPQMKVKLKYFGGKESELSVGLVNPIDKSTYVTLSNQEAIYRVDSLKGSLESLNLASFIDSKIFTQKIGSIKQFKIYKGKIPSTTTRLHLSKDKETWLIDSKKQVDPASVIPYLEEVLELKSSLILDKRTEKLDSFIERYLGNPQYSLEIETDKGKVFYEISYLLNTIPDTKMEKRQTFLIKASNRPHPYVIEKNHMNIFYKTEKSFKKLSIKKLFY
ncbi:DUF4340 domain-containing protein [Halobacteriovorax sp. HLS]|uniref:DUF4340 domain-containing protein n=1 Tax=Halobacteriovorax sp. HLS TaxID=2234000 RepID=UPI000FDBB186|nr:DUF4340 domain-containing protein [Halobacteriovorax sp. HLS]